MISYIFLVFPYIFLVFCYFFLGKNLSKQRQGEREGGRSAARQDLLTRRWLDSMKL